MSERFKYLKKIRRKLVNRIMYSISIFFRNFFGGQSTVGDEPLLKNIDFSFIPEIEKNWKLIYSEMENILKFRNLIPAFHEVSKDQKTISKRNKWKTFGLFGFGYKFKKNCSFAPKTTELLEKIPGLQTAWFSIISPGYHIPSHTGVTKSIIRGHLGLKIPQNTNGCYMNVGGKRVQWEQGKILIFDDTYDHAVWNNTNEERIVLLFDFDRPMKYSGRLLHNLSLKVFKKTNYYSAPVKNLKEIEKKFHLHATNIKSSINH